MRQRIVATLLVSTVIVLLNETIMVVALPHIMADLDVSASAGQWLTTAYMLTMAVLIPTSGFVLQRFSSRAVFGAALGTFSIGALLAAIAQAFPLLLAARVVQAAGASMMGPLLMATVLRVAPPGRRGQMLGTVTITLAVAPALGPVVSGLVLQFLPWRSMFIGVLPITLAALAHGLVRLAGADRGERRRLDVVSVGLTVPGFGLFVFGLNRLADSGGQSGPTLGLATLGVGLFSLALFFLRQIRLGRGGDPLLDLGILRYGAYRWSIGVLLLAMVVNFGVLLIVPLFLQNVRGLNPLTTGMVMLGGGVFSGVIGRLAGWLCDRYGSRWLMVLGTATLAMSTFALSLATSDTPVWMLAIEYSLLTGVGMGLIATPALTHGVNPLTPRLYPHGIAFVSTFQQVAGAAGNALLITVLVLSAGSAEGARRGDAAGIRTSLWVAVGIAATALVLAAFGKPGHVRGVVVEAAPQAQFTQEEKSA